MTMDIQGSAHMLKLQKSPRIENTDEPKVGISIQGPTNSNGSHNKKRSFDVAFLMLPDDKKSKKRHYEESAPTKIELSVRSDLTRIENRQKLINNNMSPSKAVNAYDQTEVKSFKENGRVHPSIEITQVSPFLQKLYDDPLLSQVNTDIDPPRSAFSKVNSTPNHSPAPPLSPDQLSCSSASPPSSPPSNQPPYFRPDYHPFMNGNSAFQAINQSNNKMKQMMYQRRVQGTPSPDIPPNYLPNPALSGAPPFPFMSPFMPQPDVLIRNPATTAVLSALLPNTMSTFQLTAQNICAKCNISFRMTSDLVYHMRSHHKNDHVQDPNRRKREEKLRCNVCSETFRERHHLTRHMTAHQDKEGDILDGDTSSDIQVKRHK